MLHNAVPNITLARIIQGGKYNAEVKPFFFCHAAFSPFHIPRARSLLHPPCYVQTAFSVDETLVRNGFAPRRLLCFDPPESFLRRFHGLILLLLPKECQQGEKFDISANSSYTDGKAATMDPVGDPVDADCAKQKRTIAKVRSNRTDNGENRQREV